MQISQTTKLEMKKAQKLINSASRIFLTTHEGTDGDDLGSALAMRLGLLALGKEVVVAVKGGVPEPLKFLKGAQEVSGNLAQLNFDLVITFGCNLINRTGFQVLQKFEGLCINIDHHPDNKLFGNVNIVEPATSSVAELMKYFFEVVDWEIDKDVATCLLTGIFTDTGGFKHANTTSETLAAASDLMKRGARIQNIAQHLIAQNNPASHRIWARALENTRFDKSKGMIYAVITEEDFTETGATDEDLSGFVTFLNSIPQARFAMLLRQDGEVVRGSVRSEPDRNVDVNKIAATFGGGGHKLASGFKVRGRLVREGNGWKII